METLEMLNVNSGEIESTQLESLFMIAPEKKRKWDEEEEDHDDDDVKDDDEDLQDDEEPESDDETGGDTGVESE